MSVAHTRLDRGAAAARIVAIAAGVSGLLLCAVAAVAHLFFGVSAHTVLTGSMRPTYEPGDVVLTVSRPLDSLNLGQIPLIVPPGTNEPVAHRIVAIERDANGHTVIRTRGDSNPAPDMWQTTESAGRVPVVVGSIPEVGYVAVALRGVALRCAVVAALGLALTVAAVRRVARRSHCADCCPDCVRAGLSAPPSYAIVRRPRPCASPRPARPATPPRPTPRPVPRPG